MKPISIVLSINLSFFIIFFLVFWFAMDRPELIPLMTGFQTLFNLLGVGGFYLDQKKDLMMAFVVGLIMCLVVTAGGFVWLNYFVKTLKIEDFSNEIFIFPLF